MRARSLFYNALTFSFYLALFDSVQIFTLIPNIETVFGCVVDQGWKNDFFLEFSKFRRKLAVFF